MIGCVKEKIPERFDKNFAENLQKYAKNEIYPNGN